MSLSPGTTFARLLEREAELEAVRRALARTAEGSGGLLVLDGPAGVGKTAMLESTRIAAAETGLLTLHARGAELEQDFAFGVMRQLFDGIVHDQSADPYALFDGAARFAAPLLEVALEGEAPAPSEDPFAARHAFYWLTANLAGRQPLAMIVDDAHWADAASLGALAHIANRLEGVPVALVIATRVDEPIPSVDALRRQAAERGTQFGLAPLTEEAAAAVVRSFSPDADDAVCRACFTATGGNPFLLNELARAIAGGALDPEHVLDATPERVTREVGARLARLPESAGRLARAAAVLGGDVPLRQAADLAEVDAQESVQAADALVAAGILRSAHPLEFLHPLVRAAIYAGLGPARRSRDHARAARLLADEGVSPERVAAQLLRCQPAGDEWAYKRLVAAARLVIARGGVEAAITYLRRALAEPPPGESRTFLLLELGTAEVRLPDPPAAIEHLREALTGLVPLGQRFDTVMMLAGMLGQTAQVEEAADLLEEELALLTDHPYMKATAEAALANVTRIHPEARRRADAVLPHLHQLVEEGDDNPAVLGTIAAELGMAGGPIDATARVAEKALVAVAANTATAPDWSGWNAIRSLVFAERYEAAMRALDRALQYARDRGAMLDVGGVCTFRSELYLQIGDLALAEVDARTLKEISEAAGWPLGDAFATAWLTEVLVGRGELDEAAALFEDGLYSAPAEDLVGVYPDSWLLLARGRLRFAQDRPEDAIADFRESGRRTLALGHVSAGLTDWRSQLAYVLHAQGQTAEAARLVAEELERARRAEAPRQIGVALRAVAFVEGGDDGIKLLREAAGILDESEAKLERARVYADLGAALRRAGGVNEARDRLKVAIELAHRCGARPLEDQALAELRETGARPRRRATKGAGALTPSERRIAELAVDGRLNREIAEALFVSTATVEFHLRNAYRKLGITSRGQLADAMGPIERDRTASSVA